MIFIGILGLIAIISISIYNGLIRRKNEVENAFGGVDVQLRKRYDLIPNLVAAVKEFATHEKELLAKVTEMRSKAISPDLSNNEKLALNDQISAGMKSIMVAVEAYPDIKSNENFLNLQRNLNEVESQIAASRRSYNAAITDYNNGIQTFPQNIFAGMLNMQKKEVFENTATERENVDVKNLFS